MHSLPPEWPAHPPSAGPPFRRHLSKVRPEESTRGSARPPRKLPGWVRPAVPSVSHGVVRHLRPALDKLVGDGCQRPETERDLPGPDLQLEVLFLVDGPSAAHLGRRL